MKLIALLTLLTVLQVASCGKKGDLYLPEDDPTEPAATQAMATLFISVQTGR